MWERFVMYMFMCLIFNDVNIFISCDVFKRLKRVDNGGKCCKVLLV